MKKIYFQIAILAITIIFSLSTIVNATDESVAKVGENTYSTLQAAIDAVSTNGTETTVTLLKDTTENITIKSGQNIILDLGTYTLTNQSESDTIYVQLGATLTIEGSGTVINNSSNNLRYPLMNNGTTTINGGTIKTEYVDGYVILNHGTMTINEAVVTSTSKDSALVANGYYNYVDNSDERKGYISGTNSPTATLTINGGSFSGGKYAVKNDEYSYLVITNGEFSSLGDFVLYHWNAAEINGGTFNGSIYVGDINDDEVWELEINGGTFYSDVIFVTDPEYIPSEKVIITGGAFNYTGGSFATGTESVDFEISGGTYSTDLTNYLAEGLKVVESENGLFSVGSGLDNEEEDDEDKNDSTEVTEDATETATNSEDNNNSNDTTTSNELDETPDTGVKDKISYILVATTIAGIGMIALRKKD